MTEDFEAQIKSLTREVKLLNKKLARSEANRTQAEKMKDETDVLYENVLKQLAEQKRMVEEAQSQLSDAFEVITSSINYASRIQRSVLPDRSLLETKLDDHFVIWHPRDRVGGDMYWIDVWGDGLLIMLGDCTGHGVPGAFMTLISAGAFERAKLNVAVGDLAGLIRRMHRLVQTTLRQNTVGGESDDGMELGVCYMPRDKGSLRFAGARFELFVVKDGVVDTLKGTNRGIGYCGIPPSQEYDVFEVPIDGSAQFYMTTDGLIDQVGGDRRRSFGKRRFRALLESICDLPMAAQRERIERALLDHQGGEPRRDDVSLIGFKASATNHTVHLGGGI